MMSVIAKKNTFKDVNKSVIFLHWSYVFVKEESKRRRQEVMNRVWIKYTYILWSYDNKQKLLTSSVILSTCDEPSLDIKHQKYNIKSRKHFNQYLFHCYLTKISPSFNDSWDFDQRYFTYITSQCIFCHSRPFVWRSWSWKGKLNWIENGLLWWQQVFFSILRSRIVKIKGTLMSNLFMTNFWHITIIYDKLFGPICIIAFSRKSLLTIC